MNRKFIGYYGPGSLPTWMQQQAVHGLINQRGCSLLHEIEETDNFNDGCFGLREARRLAIEHHATLVVYSLKVLSKNFKLFLEIRDQVPVMVCELGGRYEHPRKDQEVQSRC